jgi:hypothetical protein
LCILGALFPRRNRRSKLSKHRHLIELEWNDETHSIDAVRGLLDGEPVAGPTVWTVLQGVVDRLTGEGGPPYPESVPPAKYRCSFCARSQNQVQRILEGPGGLHACNECIEVMYDALKEGVIPS